VGKVNQTPPKKRERKSGKKGERKAKKDILGIMGQNVFLAASKEGEKKKEQRHEKKTHRFLLINWGEGEKIARRVGEHPVVAKKSRGPRGKKGTTSGQGKTKRGKE